MGYSCTSKASQTLAYIEQLYQSPDTRSQVLRFERADYYFERGRENADGAITGTLNRFDNSCYPVRDDSRQVTAVRVGSVRIEPDGFVSRFPALTGHQRQAINSAVVCGLPRGTASGL